MFLEVPITSLFFLFLEENLISSENISLSKHWSKLVSLSHFMIFGSLFGICDFITVVARSHEVNN